MKNEKFIRNFGLSLVVATFLVVLTAFTLDAVEYNKEKEAWAVYILSPAGDVVGVPVILFDKDAAYAITEVDDPWYKNYDVMVSKTTVRYN